MAGEKRGLTEPADDGGCQMRYSEWIGRFSDGQKGELTLWCDLMSLPGFSSGDVESSRFHRRFSDLVAAVLVLSCLSGCTLLGPDRYGRAAINGGSELLSEVRAVAKEEGMPAARDLVAQRLSEADESEGELERRVMRTTRKPDLVLPDSLAALSLADRQRIAIVIVPGTQTGFGGPSKTRACLHEAAKAAEEMGFLTHFIDTPPRGAVSENAVLVAEQIAPIFDQADHVALVMLSKGAHDLIYYLQEYALDLPADQRAKIDLVLSLVGTVQGSVVADYFANAPRLVPISARLSLRVKGAGDQIDMLKTVGRSPWRPEDARRMGEAFPNLTWVSLAMVPDGADGEIAEKLWSPFIRWRIARNSPYYSPADGLVETAATVLPDEVVLPEWIVRAYGSHSMPNGHYIDGSRVAPQTTVPGDEELKPISGGEVMNAYLRALPRSLLHYPH